MTKEHEAEKSSNRSFVIVILLFAGAILICGGPLTWLFVRRGNAFAELERRRAGIVARGLPIDDASMEAFRSENMEHEFSERWQEVHRIVTSREFQDSSFNVPILGAGVSDAEFIPGEPYEYDQVSRDFLEQWKELREEIHDITVGGGAIWSDIKMDSFNTLFPQSISCRSIARLLKLEFENAVRRADSEQACASIRALIGTSRSLEKEPILISQLVSIAIFSMATDSIRVAVEQDLLDEEQLLAVLDDLRARENVGDCFRLAIAGERALGQPIFDDLGRFGDGQVSSSFTSRPVDALASLDFFERVEAIDTDDLSDFLVGVEDLEQSVAAEIASAGWLRKMDTAVTSLLVPAVGAAGRAFVRSEMETRICKLGIALRLYQKRQGKLPESLDALTEANTGVELGPVSPVGSLPFGYQSTGDEGVLWGFEPHSAEAETPGEPTSDSEIGSENDRERFWNWRLNET